MLNKLKEILMERLTLCILFVASISLGTYLGLYKSCGIGLLFTILSCIIAMVLLAKEFTSMVDEMYD